MKLSNKQIFFDYELANIEAVQSLEINSFLYTNLDQFEKDLNKFNL